ncbi:uncharacterized protein LOC100883510 [Megachile rotundata]|uniref:uncharacterized protein LOC100883510 n=1 Tax=Megachile rotundata TaxID=143995 RepID=UPI000614C515|nr:PREDICTED: uncharacterized protein LOC100883510 [Megachile rotundata]
MDSFEDDMFALSDEELPLPTSNNNPIEEYLMKQLSNVQTRIEKANDDIKIVQDTTKHILKSLYYEAEYGESITSDSDSDLYTIDGEPVIKKKQKREEPDQVLVVQNDWKCVFCDKWIIGIVVRNTSIKTLNNVRFYTSVEKLEEIAGLSMIWYLMDGTFWCKTDTIQSHQQVVATVVLDLPNFRKDSFYEAYGTISYEIDEKRYQTPTPVIRLGIDDTLDNSCGLKFSSNLDRTILALKSASVERIVNVQIEGNPERGERLLGFLQAKSFKEISPDVYVAKATGSLMYCLIEILPIVEGEARLRIFSRSLRQMNILLRLLRDRFPDIIVQHEDNSVYAAMVLLEELKLHLKDASSVERQMARIRTDLLIA